jgi:tetratricopeptide (TPR) repeat protein
MQPSLQHWKTITRLEPFLAEFDQRIKGKDYEKAFNVIESIDAHLSGWGYYHYVINRRKMLRNRFSDIREALNLRFLSSAYLNAGKYDYAHSEARRAREVAREYRNESEEAVALMYSGAALYNLGQYRLAGENYQEALTLARAAKNNHAEGSILGRLGALYGNLAQHTRALQYEKEALSIANLTQNQGAKCSALSWMGTLWTEMGAFDKALRCHREALATARESNLRKSEGICLAQMGMTFREFGSYGRAMESFELSLSIAKELHDTVTEMKALGGIGKLHLLKMRNEVALKNFLRARAIARELNMEGPQQHWGTCVAQVYLHENQLIDAIRNIPKPPSEYLPWNKHRVALLKGIILARWFRIEPRDGMGKARAAFEEARKFSDQLLTTTPEYYGAAYIRCLSFFGLGLISSGTERNKFLRRARVSLKRALARCAKPGVLNDYLRLLSELTPLDPGNILAAARKSLDI